MLVAGIDTSGASGTKNYSIIAWLDTNTQTFTLDAYSPTQSNPLPISLHGSPPRFIGFDSPQSLPISGKTRRNCDEKAKTPTSVLPSSRAALSNIKLYKGLIVTGIDIFWNSYTNQTANIYGLTQTNEVKPTIFETYPRYVIRKWLSEQLINKNLIIEFNDIITNKRDNPMRYVDFVWSGLRNLGYISPGIEKPSVDQLDAMLCAVVAHHLSVTPNYLLANTVGKQPSLDLKGRVLREGYIVCP